MSPEDILREGVREAIADYSKNAKRVTTVNSIIRVNQTGFDTLPYPSPLDYWVQTQGKGQKYYGKCKSAMIKPSLRGLATTTTRTRAEHESAISVFQSSLIAPSYDDVIPMEHVNQSDRNAVLCAMRLAAITTQKKFFKEG